MIGIIDYGLGNIMAFKNAFDRLNAPVIVAKSADDLVSATQLVLPGVGSFDHAMKQFNASGMRQAVENLVLQQSVPILGVCVGMQMLAKSSDEGQLPGLGWIDARVRKFDPVQMSWAAPLPHMGWNDVLPRSIDGLFRGLDSGAHFYFLHSYYFECNDPEDILATTDYGMHFSCAVKRGNIHGVQFHPEKSHHFGSQLLKNLAEL